MAVVSDLSRWSGERAKPSAPGDDAYLSIVNAYRAQAGLAPVDTNPAWEEGNRKHARYMVENDVIQHFEDPGNPWYTAEGDAAATSSNLVGGRAGPGSNAAYAIKVWMQAPFHAVGILDPRLQTTGYGEYSDASSPGISWGAGLDVIRGLGSAPPGVTYPIVWPGDQTMVAIREHTGEFPSPLTSCPGYQSPSGLPLVVQFADTPNVTEHSFSVGGVALAHCVFDETNYENPDPAEESLGRAVLSGRNAVVLIPKERLNAGETYSASFTSNGETVDWSFAIGPAVTVSVTKAGTGSGHVRSLEYPEPEIDCGATCAARYLVGDWVSLLAEPDPGSVFSGWSSGCSGTGFCEIPSLDHDTVVTAEFAGKPTVTVSKSGDGAGTVTSLPSGINCGSTCSAAFDVGAGVVLNARPEEGSTFTGWSGDCQGAASSCDLALSTDRTASASFELEPQVSHHAVDVSLKLKRHLRATVEISSPSLDACSLDSIVKIQRWGRGRLRQGRWKQVAKALPPHGAKSRLNIGDKPGRYRAKTSGFSVGELNRCEPATSLVIRHEHGSDKAQQVGFQLKIWPLI